MHLVFLCDRKFVRRLRLRAGGAAERGRARAGSGRRRMRRRRRQAMTRKWRRRLTFTHTHTRAPALPRSLSVVPVRLLRDFALTRCICASTEPLWQQSGITFIPIDNFHVSIICCCARSSLIGCCRHVSIDEGKVERWFYDNWVFVHSLSRWHSVVPSIIRIDNAVVMYYVIYLRIFKWADPGHTYRHLSYRAYFVWSIKTAADLKLVHD